MIFQTSLNKGKSFKIAIASGKGGTGKTFVSSNLFNVISKKCYSVALVDCDAEEPNTKQFFAGTLQQQLDITQGIPLIDKDKCTYCGRCAEYCHYNAIICIADMNFIEVMADLCHGCGACFIACNDDAIKEVPDLLGYINKYNIRNQADLIEARMKVGVHSPVSIIKKAIKDADDYDIALLDSPPGTSCSFIQTVNLADFVVLVTEPTPFGLSDLKQSATILKNMGKPFGVVINKDGLGTNDVEKFLDEEAIPDLLHIPFDKEIAAIYSVGKLLTDEDDFWADEFYKLYQSIFKHA